MLAALAHVLLPRAIAHGLGLCDERAHTFVETPWFAMTHRHTEHLLS
jgi:hypothetical protein